MASCEAFDNAGLYFAMAVLVNDGELPQTPIIGIPKTLDNESEKEELEQVMDERDEIAKEKIEEYGFASLISSELL